MSPVQTMPALEHYARALEERAENQTLRSLRSCLPRGGGKIEIEGKELVNFSSNDYLGLSQHPLLIERSAKFAEKYGVGSGASRLLGGNLSVYEQIESKLAALKGTEAALILPTGFQANSSIIPSFLSKTSVAAADRLIHKSMVEGLLLSGSHWFRFAHNNYADMEERLARFQEHEGTRWLITESVFSMDGDRSDIDALTAVCSRNNFAIFIDEAHATGVLGKNGMGLTAGLSISGISMGTFGKGLGSFGAYVCLPKLMRDYLINFCPGLIYSTALPPPVLGAIDAALDLIPGMESDRASLKRKSEFLRAELQQLGFETGLSSTQIIPILIGSTRKTLDLSQHLEQSGFYVPAIRPPTVAEGSSRLRVSLSAAHTDDQIEKFLDSLRKWHEKTG